MRKRARTDANQTEIVAVLRKWGASVQSLAVIGNGCPDLLVSHRGVNYLLEVKDGAKAPSEKRLTRDEADWHAKWAGQVAVVENAQQAVDIVIGASV